MLCLLALQAPAELPLPAGGPITLDGEVAEAEWSDAHVLEAVLSGERRMRLRLKRTGPWLAVGITADRAYGGEILRYYVSDADDDWIASGILGLGHPTMPPMIWRRALPDQLRSHRMIPGAARACRLRARLESPERWSAECLVRLSVLGIGRADLRRFVTRLLIVDATSPGRGALIAVPNTITDPFDATAYAPLVSPDGWGRDETWEPISTATSLEFDDNTILHELFLEREEVRIGDEPVSTVISRAVQPRRLEAVRALDQRLLEGQARNPTLPAWRLYRAHLLHQAGLIAEARKILDELPPPLQQLHPFRRMAAELSFDSRDWDAAIEWASPIALQKGMRELIAASRKGAEMEASEKSAIAADGKKNNPRLRVVTSRGEFEIELFEDDAPRAVRNFMDLVMAQKFYDGQRVHDAFGANYVTIGDPRSRGDGPPDPEAPDGPGWMLKADAPKRPLLPGYLATALRGQGLYHGSQFAIALSPLLAEGLKVAVFGRVTKGMDVVRSLEFEDRIERIEVISKRDHDYDAVACRLRN